jgi:uncharacterized surface protein with fasciclin (FAS1) repeats
MRMSRSKKFAAVIAVAALGFGVAACGDDDTSSSDETVVVDDTTGDDAAADSTIVDIAVGNPDFSFLVTALEAAGLVETLAGEGPFTVLAPTDAAFLALAQELIGPEATLDDLAATLTEDPAILEYILLTHVISGNVLAADTVELDGQDAESLSGEMLTVASDGTTVSFTTGASTVTVTAADIIGSNGVIHVIDKVIIPIAQQS